MGDPRIAFGSFVLDVRQRILERSGEVLPLTPKAIDTLILLVENAGEVVDKETIMQRLWPGTFVVESSLTRNISVLRKTLGCEGQYIETLSKRGYRFVAPITAAPQTQPRKIRRVLVAAATAVLLLTLAHVPTGTPPRAFDGNAEARRLAAVGSYHWHKLTADDLRKAETHYLAAVAADPRSASAWAGLADTYLAMAQTGSSYRLPKAKEAAQRAMALNAKLAAPHSSLALAVLLTEFDWRKAEAGYLKSIRLDAAYLPAYAGYSRMLMALRRFDEAGRWIHKAQERDPASPLFGFLEGRLHYLAGRYEQAAGVLRMVIEREPRYDAARYYLALAYSYTGRYEDALRELRASGRHRNLEETEEAWILARSGHTERASALLASRVDQVDRGQANPIVLPVVAMAAGRADVAISALERCLDRRSIELLALLSEPRFAPLRGNPRFEALVSRIHPSS